MYVPSCNAIQEKCATCCQQTCCSDAAQDLWRQVLQIASVRKLIDAGVPNVPTG